MPKTVISPLEETKRHGSVLFPFNIYPCTIPKDFPSVALHWHRSMELIYIKKGSGAVQMGDSKYTANAGDIFVIPPENLHAIRALNGKTMEYENIIFDPEFLGSGAADICARQYLIPLSGGKLLQSTLVCPEDPQYPQISGCITFAEQLCTDKSHGYELGVKGSMLQMLLHLIRMNPHPPAAESRDTARLKQVLQQVRQDYAQPLTVAQMAQSCGFSSSHFMRWFRQMTGSSFSAYVKEYRLAAAAEKLRLTIDKILTIASESGFESLANFNRQVKDRYGVTPRDYRKS